MKGMGQRLGLTPAGGCDSGGGVAEGRELCLLPPEHRGAIYCDQAHYGPLYGSGVEARAKSDNAVVGTGGSGFGGDADGGLGGGVDGGGVGDGRDGKETATDN